MAPVKEGDAAPRKRRTTKGMAAAAVVAAVVPLVQAFSGLEWPVVLVLVAGAVAALAIWVRGRKKIG